MEPQSPPPLTPEEIYALKLRTSGGFWILEDKTLVIQGKDKNASLTRKGYVLTPCCFLVGGTAREKVILKCTCHDAKEEYSIISNTLPIFQSEKDFVDFVSLREKKACMHVKTVLLPLFYIWDSITYSEFIKDYDETDVPMLDGPVAFLCDHPRLIAVNDGITWAVFGRLEGRSAPQQVPQ